MCSSWMTSINPLHISTASMIYLLQDELRSIVHGGNTQPVIRGSANGGTSAFGSNPRFFLSGCWRALPAHC